MRMVAIVLMCILAVSGIFMAGMVYWRSSADRTAAEEADRRESNDLPIAETVRREENTALQDITALLNGDDLIEPQDDWFSVKEAEQVSAQLVCARWPVGPGG